MVIIVGKILLQNTWMANITCHEEVSTVLHRESHIFYSLLLALSTLKIPGLLSTIRAYSLDQHVFVDASKKTYTDAVYLCVSCEERVNVIIVFQNTLPFTATTARHWREPIENSPTHSALYAMIWNLPFCSHQTNQNWHFIPPIALHHGGLCEADMKSVKHHFWQVIGARLELDLRGEGKVNWKNEKTNKIENFSFRKWVYYLENVLPLF